MTENEVCPKKRMLAVVPKIRRSKIEIVMTVFELVFQWVFFFCCFILISAMSWRSYCQAKGYKDFRLGNTPYSFVIPYFKLLPFRSK